MKEIHDPSLTETQAGFTYYVSVDGGAYTSSGSPKYLLSSGISTGAHTVTGYVTDSLGTASIPVSWTGTVQPPQVQFTNYSGGRAQVSWTGGPPPQILAPEQVLTIAGTGAGLTVTLLDSGTSSAPVAYGFVTNGTIDQRSNQRFGRVVHHAERGRRRA
jgi:hypothetical protein